MNCPTCHLPVSFRDEDCHCTVPAKPLRTAMLAAQVYRKALESTPLDYRAKGEILAQVDEQLAFLEGVYV